MLLGIIAELAQENLETGLGFHEAIIKAIDDVMVARKMTLEGFTERIKEECQI
jgi:hypothetical protein